MSEGIKETKELLTGLNTLAIELINVLKDGVSASDAVTLLAHISSSDSLKKALEDAYQGISAVPTEIKDINLAEALELAALQIEFIPQVVTAMKKA